MRKRGEIGKNLRELIDRGRERERKGRGNDGERI